jgi:hypothetical protein
LKEDEEGKDNGQQRGGEGFDDAAELIEASGGAADFTDLDGVVGGGADGTRIALAGGRQGASGVGDAELLADVLDLPLGTAVCGVAGAVEGAHFLRDVVAVSREIVGDSDELGEDAPSCDAQESGENENYGHGGDGARQAKAFEKSDDGSKEESEKDGESQGEEENFGEIEDGDSENRDGDEPELRKHAWDRGGVHRVSMLRS